MMDDILIKIEKDLYIGNSNITSNSKVLKDKNIYHIIIVGRTYVDTSEKEFNYMILDIQNEENENILFNFDSIYEYIESGLSKGSVIICSDECISRSPTILIAYLIKKKGLTLDDALTYVKELKQDINPIQSFIDHLKLFEKAINKANENIYKCNICRKTLFDDSNIDFIHEYTPKSNYSYKRYKKSFVTSNECSSYFLNSLSIINLSDNIGQRINCPNNKCNNKIGEYFPKGSQCSCGSWVVPAIQILKSKIDKQPIIK